MITQFKNLLIILIILIISKSYQKTKVRSNAEILNEYQIYPNISATPQSVFTLLKKINHQGVLTFPENILSIFQRINQGYQLSDEEIKLLKLCRITAARQNGQIKNLHDNTFLGYLRFDTNKLSFRGCGTVLGMKGDALPFSKAIATTVIEIDHLGGPNATFEPFPILDLLTVDRLTKQELRVFNFDNYTSTHLQHQSNRTQNSTQIEKSNHTGTETSLPTESKSHDLIRS